MSNFSSVEFGNVSNLSSIVFGNSSDGPKLPEVFISQYPETELDYKVIWIPFVIFIVWMTAYFISFYRTVSYYCICFWTGMFIPLGIWEILKFLIKYCQSKCCTNSNCMNIYNDNTDVEMSNCEKNIYK